MAISWKSLGLIAVIIVAAAVELAAISLNTGGMASTSNGSPPAQVERIMQSGRGDGVSKKYTLEAGVVVLQMI